MRINEGIDCLITFDDPRSVIEQGRHVKRRRSISLVLNPIRARLATFASKARSASASPPKNLLF